MNKSKRNRISKILGITCIFALLIGSFAFFTDREEQNATATAGNIDLVFVDVSDADAYGTDDQDNTKSGVWTPADGEDEGAIASNIINPGDQFDMGYELRNTGSKSIDVRQQIILESDKEMTDAAQEYTLNGTVLTLDETNSTATKLIYTYEDITLAGSAEADGNAWDETKGYSSQDFDVYLQFAREAKNAFMDSNVNVTLEVQAKQHRNTTGEDWMKWASFGTGSDTITYEEIPVA